MAAPHRVTEENMTHASQPLKDLQEGGKSHLEMEWLSWSKLAS